MQRQTLCSEQKREKTDNYVSKQIDRQNLSARLLRSIGQILSKFPHMPICLLQLPTLSSFRQKLQTQKSRTPFCSTLRGCPRSWSSKKSATIIITRTPRVLPPPSSFFSEIFFPKRSPAKAMVTTHQHTDDRRDSFFCVKPQRRISGIKWGRDGKVRRKIWLPSICWQTWTPLAGPRFYGPHVNRRVRLSSRHSTVDMPCQLSWSSSLTRELHDEVMSSFHHAWLDLTIDSLSFFPLQEKPHRKILRIFFSKPDSTSFLFREAFSRFFLA